MDKSNFMPFEKPKLEIIELGSYDILTLSLDKDENDGYWDNTGKMDQDPNKGYWDAV